MQVAIGAELGGHRDVGVAFGEGCPDAYPPALVGGKIRGVLGGAGVGHLRALRVADARVHMARVRDRQRERLSSSTSRSETTHQWLKSQVRRTLGNARKRWAVRRGWKGPAAVGLEGDLDAGAAASSMARAKNSMARSSGQLSEPARQVTRERDPSRRRAPWPRARPRGACRS